MSYFGTHAKQTEVNRWVFAVKVLGYSNGIVAKERPVQPASRQNDPRVLSRTKMAYCKSTIPFCVLLACFSTSHCLVAQDDAATRRVTPKMTSLELAKWIDGRFGNLLKEQEIDLAPLVDDATFMRRVYLDLVGTIPTVSQVRDFLEAKGTFKRPDLVDRLVHDDTRPERYATRGAEHMARIFRRVMIPPSSPGAKGVR